MHSNHALEAPGRLQVCQARPRGNPAALVNLLQAQLSMLEVERDWIEQQGYLLGCWVARDKPGGTARTDKVYWQARSTEAMFSGKRAKHLKADEVSEVQAQVVRGRRLLQLRQQIASIETRIVLASQG